MKIRKGLLKKFSLLVSLGHSEVLVNRSSNHHRMRVYISLFELDWWPCDLACQQSHKKPKTDNNLKHNTFIKRKYGFYYPPYIPRKYATYIFFRGRLMTIELAIFEPNVKSTVDVVREGLTRKCAEKLHMNISRILISNLTKCYSRVVWTSAICSFNDITQCKAQNKHKGKGEWVIIY